jgi:hypothetical protein
MPKKILMVDAPEGWLHDFPKPAPEGFLKLTPNQKTEWFKNNGYPQELINQGMLRYVRYYTTEVEDD